MTKIRNNFSVMGLFEKDFGKLVYVEVFLSPDKSESLNEKVKFSRA